PVPPLSPYTTLFRSTDVADGGVGLAAAEAVERSVLVVDPGLPGYRFRHALLREAVYDALLPGERCRLHRRVATTLAAHPELGARSEEHTSELQSPDQ